MRRGSQWKRSNEAHGPGRAAERKRLLLRWADAIERDAERLALLECIETGRPLREARAVDIAFCGPFEHAVVTILAPITPSARARRFLPAW